MLKSLLNSATILFNSTTNSASKGATIAFMATARSAPLLFVDHLLFTSPNQSDVGLPNRMLAGATYTAFCTGMAVSIGYLTGAAYGFANGMKEIITSSGSKEMSKTAEKNITKVMGAGYTTTADYLLMSTYRPYTITHVLAKFTIRIAGAYVLDAVAERVIHKRKKPATGDDQAKSFKAISHYGSKAAVMGYQVTAVCTTILLFRPPHPLRLTSIRDLKEGLMMVSVFSTFGGTVGFLLGAVHGLTNGSKENVRKETANSSGKVKEISEQIIPAAKSFMKGNVIGAGLTAASAYAITFLMGFDSREATGALFYVARRSGSMPLILVGALTGGVLFLTSFFSKNKNSCKQQVVLSGNSPTLPQPSAPALEYKPQVGEDEFEPGSGSGLGLSLPISVHNHHATLYQPSAGILERRVQGAEEKDEIPRLSFGTASSRGL